MSGNTTRAAVLVGRGDWQQLAPAIGVIPTFVLGAAIGTVIVGIFKKLAMDTTTSAGRMVMQMLGSFADDAERAIMQSHTAEVAVWPAVSRCETPHYSGSKI
jgi:uncharacterized membrane protein YoaK (UPF0700 family)